MGLQIAARRKLGYYVRADRKLGRISFLLLLAAFSIRPAAAQDDWAFRPPTSTGPAVGQRIPAFRAPDQNGRLRDFNSIKGPNGAALYFMRSVDW